MLALNIGRRSFAQLLQPLGYSQVASIPFLWLERAVVSVSGVSTYSLRLVPLLSGIALLWATYRLTHRLMGPLSAVIALCLVATSYPLVRYSVETKPYILDALIGVLLVQVAVELLVHLDISRWWTLFVIGSLVGLLVSTSSLMVCASAATGLGVAALRSRRYRLFPLLVCLGVIWFGVFAMAYTHWYAPVADSPYMRQYWSAAFLRLGTPNLAARVWLGLQESACTLTCWRGGLDLTPAFLLLGAVGTFAILRRAGLESGLLVAGPPAFAFLASILGRYPIVTRTILFSAPLIAVMVASGAAMLALAIEARYPRLRSRWTLALLLYPSILVTVTLIVLRPASWGVTGVDIRPLARDFQLRGRGEPVYVFARSVPPWVFHTTVWGAPDTARLRYAERIAGPYGPGFVNAETRGPRPPLEGSGLLYRNSDFTELFGVPTGSQARAMQGYFPVLPDSGWAENEAGRIRRSAHPFIWIVISDFTHPGSDEGAILMNAVRALGGTVVYQRNAADAVLYRVRFASQGTSE